MANAFRSSRDIIIRTDALAEAAIFYGSVLGLPAVEHGDTLIGFETGAFCLYVEKGENHGPVFEFLVADIEDTKHRLLSAGCIVVEENASIPRDHATGFVRHQALAAAPVDEVWRSAIGPERLGFN